MTTVTATPQPADGAVQLLVTAAPAGPVTITRVDARGAGPVRLLAGQAPIGGTLSVTDYEPALSGPIRYDVRDAVGALVSTSTQLVGVTAPRVSVPVLPQFTHLVTGAILDMSEDRATSHTVHQVVGRPDPLVVMGRLAPRTGRLQILEDSRAAAADLIDTYSKGEVVLVRAPDTPELDAYHVATATRVTRAQNTGRWLVDIDYTEVAGPTSPLLGALGWNFATVAEVGSFEAVRVAFSTFADLAVGR